MATGKNKRKTEAQKEREAAAPKRRTLEELLTGANAYEKAIAAHVLARMDAALEAAIAEHQRSVSDCLRYIAGEARKRAHGASCVMMADDEVFGLAVHYFMDGDTPSGVEAGAAVQGTVETPAPPAKPAGDGARKTKDKAKAKKQAKAEKPKPKYEQLFFDFGGAEQ